MNQETFKRLEYDKVKEHLLTYAMSYLGKAHIEKLEPMFDPKMLQNLLQEAEEAKTVIATGSSVPIPSLEGIEKLISILGKGYILSVNDLTLISSLVQSTINLKRFMSSKQSIAPRVSSYAASLYDLSELRDEIERCIRNGQITDHASNELSRARKKIAVIEERIKKKLESTMQKYRSYLMENVVSMRNDRYVIPVKKEYRKLIKGAVLDESSSGQTVFIEPADILTLQQELNEQRSEEAAEEMKILSMLTELVDLSLHEIHINLETLGHYDFLFAKAKYARAIDGRAVPVNTQSRITIIGGKHPLLGAKTVPLEFSIGFDYDALIITGPNTGGKTVSLKTVGLLTLMVQSGLLVPVEQGSSFSIYTNILADIGDGQSIEQSLSTFSSHIKNVINILNVAGPSTLILLDELATGTDPGEGIGLSIAVLEELYKRGSTIIATTHFNEIKKYAEMTPGFQNARMEFDVETLQPLYRLKIGEAGNSYAFYIALKLGISPAIVERSRQITSSVANSASGSGIDLQSVAIPLSSERKQREKQAAGKRESNPNENHRQEFEIGDCVWIHALKRTGIVCEKPDEKGNVLVLIQKEKVKINRKRMSLYIERNNLYPEGDYDMDIVFESKENRKKRKLMSRKYVKDVVIEIPKEKQ